MKKREIIVAEIEENSYSNTVHKIVDIINMAVATFNGEKLRKSNDWKEHIQILLDSNGIKNNSEYHELGFSGSHFWLDEKQEILSTNVDGRVAIRGEVQERVYFVYPVNI